jgi:SAM-dependent methyltransferase
MSFRSKLQRAMILISGPAVQRRQTWNLIVMAARGVDLTYVPLTHLGLDGARSCEYADSGGPELEDVLRELPITSTDVALDLGCGKGGALFSLSKFFRRVTGVEISPELAAVAEKNIEKLGIGNVGVIRSDAATFDILDEYTYVYMFNPFTSPVMKQVLENLRASLERRPRSLIVIYKNPVCSEMLRSTGFTLLRTFSHASQPFHVYAMSNA